MKKSEKRFSVEEFKAQGMLGIQNFVLTDEQTGVQYLYCAAGYGAGLCPLLGADGQPLLHPDHTHEM